MAGEHKYEVYHMDCGGIAFYYDGDYVQGGLIRPEFAVMPDGTTPKASQPMSCGACKRNIHFGEGMYLLEVATGNVIETSTGKSIKSKTDR